MSKLYLKKAVVCVCVCVFFISLLLVSPNMSIYTAGPDPLPFAGNNIFSLLNIWKNDKK